MYLVACPLNESEADVDLVLTESSLLFLGIFLLISMRTASCSINRNARKVSIKTRSTPTSLSFEGQATKHTTVKLMVYSTISLVNNAMKKQIRIVTVFFNAIAIEELRN